jgi:hypothetical protein
MSVGTTAVASDCSKMARSTLCESLAANTSATDSLVLFWRAVCNGASGESAATVLKTAGRHANIPAFQ